MAAAKSRALPMSIPSSLHHKCNSSEPPTRNTSCMSLTSGSYIGSVMNLRRRRASMVALNTPPPSTSATTERKLSRTRRMSEVAKSPDSVGGKTPRIMRIPTEKGDITREWARVIVNQYLLKYEKTLIEVEDQIIDFEVFNCKSSCGDFSCTYKIDIAVAPEPGARDHYSFIAKLLPADDSDRIHVFEANLLEKEIEMYFEVLPSLQQFLRTQNSGDQSAIVEASVPECIYGRHNMDGAGVLVFNSSLNKGFAHSSDPEGLNQDELNSAVETLARIHASGKALLTAKTPNKVKNRYPFLTKDMYSNGKLQDDLDRQLAIYGDLLASGPDAEMKAARESFEQLRASVSIWDMLDGLKRQGPASLTTIIHGELWEKNILFRPSDNKCLILDWKNAKIATPTLDLAFLIYSSTNIGLLSSEAGHRPLLETYHEAFCATLRSLEPKCPEPTFSELEQDFKRSSKDALLQAICMFVQEMQYLDGQMVGSAAITRDGSTTVTGCAEALQLYERRAMNLLTSIDLGSLSPATSTPSSPQASGLGAGGFAIGTGSDDEEL